MNGENKIDITGNTYKGVTVVGFSHMKNGRSFWECKCHKCDRITIFSGTDAKKALSCQKCGRSRVNASEIGKRNGSFVVVDVFSSRNRMHFRCLCDCGRTKIVKRKEFVKNESIYCRCSKDKCNEFIGTSFNHIKIVSYAGINAGNRKVWIGECICGNKLELYRSHIENKTVLSCGCKASENGINTRIRRSNYVSKRKPIEYRHYRNMITRCFKESYIEYSHYGGRGITVCDRWLGEKGFENFLSDMGKRPSKTHSLDRIDNNGNYCPENCRWATRIEQANNKSTNNMMTINGITRTMSEWCKDNEIKYGTVWRRVKKGWSHYDALYAPLRVN